MTDLKTMSDERRAVANTLSGEIKNLGQMLEQTLISISREGAALRALGDTARARVYENLLGALDPLASAVFPSCSRSLDKIAASNK